MKILFVINNFHAKGNGLSTSARRTIKKLIERGLDIKVLSSNSEENRHKVLDFQLEEMKIPVFDVIIKAQGYSFAKVNKDIITEAVAWADIVHLEEPFALQKAVVDEALMQNKVCTATYHLHPETIFRPLGLKHSETISYLLLKYWQKTIFDKVVAIQCPTRDIVKRLQKAKFKAKLYEISNGIKIDANCVHKGHDEKGIMHIACIGRFSLEKGQSILLEALKYSKYARFLKVHFAGKGPAENLYRKEAEKLFKEGYLEYMPDFSFMNIDGLKELSATSDLYIHCASLEVEGLSCLEAIAHGAVPIIAQGKLTATPQFALDERSLFPVYDAKALAEKIDYWYEHEEERKEMAQKYIDSTKKYDIEKAIDALVEMFKTAYENKAAE